MKLRLAKHGNHALTLMETLVIIVVLAFLAALFFDMGPGGQRKAKKISCENNLKQVALAIKIWSGDSGDRYPMAVSITNGGAMEWMLTTNAWKVFGVMSNELSTPKVIYCPQDALHGRPATNFTDDLKNQISYFIGAEASDVDPQLLLAGDDNFLLNQSPICPGLIDPASNDMLKWDDSRHVEVKKQDWFNQDKKINYGNVALTDGSVQSFTSSGLTNALHQASLAPNRLVIP